MLKYSDGVICNLKHVIVLQMGTFFSMILYHARNKGAFAFRKKLLSYSEFFDLTSKNKKRFFARSAFLQGLTLMDVSDIPEGLEKAKGYVRELDDWCKRYGFSRLIVSEFFSLNDEKIDFFVFGGDSVQQLKEVVEVSEREDLPESLKRDLSEQFAAIERGIILPNLWDIRKS